MCHFYNTPWTVRFILLDGSKNVVLDSRSLFGLLFIIVVTSHLELFHKMGGDISILNKYTMVSFECFIREKAPRKATLQK